MVIDAEGMSRISEEDFAVAILDEIEEPRNVRKQFCIAY
jgi:putative NADH-flavin reductase